MTYFRHAALAAALLAGVGSASAQTTVITREPVESRAVVTTQPLELTPVQRQTIYRTIVRDPDANTARHGSGEAIGSGRLIPAAETTTLLSEKHPDVTVLYHIKGSAAPSTTTMFRETLGAAPSQDREWHWAIVQAKGISPEKQQKPPAH